MPQGMLVLLMSIKCEVSMIAFARVSKPTTRVCVLFYKKLRTEPDPKEGTNRHWLRFIY